MGIREKLERLDAERIKRVFLEFIDFYTNPSFGVVKQREIDIFIFRKLMELGVFSDRVNIYEIVTDLRITRARARSLTYEANLRMVEDRKKLDNALKKTLKDP